MAKTTIQIPKMDITITCHNKRELRAAEIFIDNMERIADAAVEGWDYALEAVREFGSGHWLFSEMYGAAGFMYHAGMLEEPLSSVECHKACRAMYLERVAAKAAPADEDDDSEKYMNEIKADAAYCLGIEYGSDEWYALAEI